MYFYSAGEPAIPIPISCCDVMRYSASNRCSSSASGSGSGELKEDMRKCREGEGRRNGA